MPLATIPLREPQKSTRERDIQLDAFWMQAPRCPLSSPPVPRRVFLRFGEEKGNFGRSKGRSFRGPVDCQKYSDVGTRWDRIVERGVLHRGGTERGTARGLHFAFMEFHGAGVNQKFRAPDNIKPSSLVLPSREKSVYNPPSWDKVIWRRILAKDDVDDYGREAAGLRLDKGVKPA
ncbi:hypothetical protein K0M31_007518 [Melipona bicolor]|uniref:Uncharacterized protein n=1 Tax=Melipona bicolor TaxID=60889 RepID=A0AA40GBK4_9HYME|nr:hypothetical protein K0M31_007518 [Melipona bicolor]